MTRAIIRDIHSDDKGRAVVMMVVDASPDKLKAQLNDCPASIQLMTMQQLKAQLKPPAPAEKGGQLCRWLHARCREKSFQNFLKARYGRSPSNPEVALEAVKSIIGFGSSRHLDNNDDLNMRFRKEIMQEYSLWLTKR
jgi:hypothetical protein